MKRRADLDKPRTSGRFDVSYDPEAFGRFSESIAKYLGTARFLVWQTVVIVLSRHHSSSSPRRARSDATGSLQSTTAKSPGALRPTRSSSHVRSQACDWHSATSSPVKSSAINSAHSPKRSRS